MRVVVATVQVPFISGGAELHAQGLVGALRNAGHPTELISLPFRFFPAAQVDRAMEVWQSEDLTSLNLYEPDIVICLKFPAYGLMHSRKVVWLLHQHRAAYDLLLPNPTAEDAALGQRIAVFDAQHLTHCRRFANSQRVAARLAQFTKLDSTPLYHPPFEATKLYAGDAMPYVFAPSRLESAKRQDLLVQAVARTKSPLGMLFAGEGGQLERLRAMAAQLGVADRVRFLGAVTWDEMRALYAHAFAVFFGPLDEDYGYVTLEAMLSRKPVITCEDSGGPLEFVVDGVTGRVVAPEPTAVAEAIDALWADRARAKRMGEAGFDRYQALHITWGCVVEQLLAAP